MTLPLRFIIPGDPVAKGRPRFTRAGMSYTPAKTRNFEQLVKMAGRDAMQGASLLDQPLELTVRVVLAVPASYSLKKRAAALAWTELPAKRPDIDNFAKAVLDGLNGVVWNDDAQVVDLITSKRYGATPGVEVIVDLACHARPIGALANDLVSAVASKMISEAA